MPIEELRLPYFGEEVLKYFTETSIPKINEIIQQVNKQEEANANKTN